MIDAVTIIMKLPARALSPNSRARWPMIAARAEQRTTAKRLAWQALRGHAPPNWTHAIAHVHFYWPTKKRRDRDNAQATLKGVWDGLQDAGVLLDDDYLVVMPAIMDHDAQRPRVEITITPDTERKYEPETLSS
jgi:Holliday junction resolvase RusA-like endonuclease